ncbi:hypothetical protein Ndes2526A_g00549 [Nannochloris sp. 'desiccata']
MDRKRSEFYIDFDEEDPPSVVKPSKKEELANTIRRLQSDISTLNHQKSRLDKKALDEKMAELKKKIAERESLKNSSTYSREHSPALSHGHEEPTQPPQPLPPPPLPPRPPPPEENTHPSYKAAAAAAAAELLQQQQQQRIGGNNNNNKRQKIGNTPVNPGYQPTTSGLLVQGGEDPMSPLPKPNNTFLPGGGGGVDGGPPRPVATNKTTTTVPVPVSVVFGHQRQFQLPNATGGTNRAVLPQPQLDAALRDIQREKQQTLARRDGLVQLLQEADRTYETLCAQEYALIVQNTGLEGLLQQQQWQPPPPPPPPLLLPAPVALPRPRPPAGGEPLAAATGNNTSTRITDNKNNKTNNNKQPPPPPPPPAHPLEGPATLLLPLQLPLAGNDNAGGKNNKKRKIDHVDVVDLVTEEEEVHEEPPAIPPAPVLHPQASPPPPPPPPLLEASSSPSAPLEEGFIPEYDAVSQSLLKLEPNDSFIRRANRARSTRPFTSLLLSPANISIYSSLSTLDIARSLLGYSLELGGYYLRPQGRFINLLRKEEGACIPLIVENNLTNVDKENDLLPVNLALASAQRTYKSIILQGTNGNSGAIDSSKSSSNAAEQLKARGAATEEILKVLKAGVEKKPTSQLLWPIFLQAYLSQPSISASQARAMIDTAAGLAPGYTTWLAAAAKAPTAISAAVILHRGAVTLVQSDLKNARKAKLAGIVLDLTLRAVRAVCCTNPRSVPPPAASGGGDAAAPTAPEVSILCQWHAAWCSPPWSPLPSPPSTETAGPLLLHPEQRQVILNSLQPHAIMLCMLWSSLAFAAAYHRLPTPVEHRLGEQQQAIGLEWPFPIPFWRLHFVASALEQGLQALRITPAVYYKYVEHLEDAMYVPKYGDPIDIARSSFVDTIRRFAHRTRNQRPLYFPGDVVKNPNKLNTALVWKFSVDGKPLPGSGVFDTTCGPHSPPINGVSPASFSSSAAGVPTSVDRVLVASSRAQAAEVLAREDHGWPCGGDVGLALFQASNLKRHDENYTTGGKVENLRDGGGGGGVLPPTSLHREGRKKSKDGNGSDMDISSEEDQDQEEREMMQQSSAGGGQHAINNLFSKSFWENQAKILVNPAATAPALPRSPSQLQWPPVEMQWVRGGAGGHLPLALEAAEKGSTLDYVQIGALVSSIKNIPAEALLPIYEEVQCRRRLNGTPAAAEICVALLRRAEELAAAGAEAAEGPKGDEHGDGDATPQPGDDAKQHQEEQQGQKKRRKKTRKGGGCEKNNILNSGTTNKTARASASGFSLLMSALPATRTPTLKSFTKNGSPTLSLSLLKEASQKGYLSKSPLVSWALPAAAGALVSSTPPAAASLWLEAIRLTALLSTTSARELLEAAVAVHPLNSVLKEAGEAVAKRTPRGGGGGGGGLI